MDPITMSVIGHSMVSVAEEMGVNLYQSAHSTVVREMRDIGTAVFDAEGQTVAMANWVPTLLNAMEPALEAIRRYYDIQELGPGEAFLTNDPFQGGQHVNDILLFTPVRHGGRVVALACANVHHLDVGGAAPASYAGATEVFQEGIVFPPMKISLDGDWTKSVFGKVLSGNIRAPEKTIPDFNAQIAACRTGERGVLALIDRYGPETILDFFREIQHYSERITRQAIGAIPDGDYRGEAYMEDDGTGSGGRFTVRVTVRIRGSEAVIDFEGTDSQARGFINSPLASTQANTRTTIMSLLGIGHRFVNCGSFRPITIEAPLGTLVNPRRPAATMARTSTCYKIFDAITLALAPVIPRQACAPGFDSQTGISFAHSNPDGTASIFSEVMGGGNGALHDQDGADGMIMALTNATNTPVEAVEIEHPFLHIEYYGLVKDSGGPGKHRGGMGMIRAYRMREDDVTFGLHSDRHKHSAPGLIGGGSGWPGRCVRLRDGSETVLGSKVHATCMKGDVIVVRTGGGAGYGPAPERDLRRVLADLDSDRISVEAARRDYDIDVPAGAG